MPFGVFQALATTYTSDVCPVQLRPYLTTYINLCWVIGQIVSSVVLRATVGRADEWGYKIPIAIQWAWPIPLGILVLLAPESPWWLVRAGRLGDAKKSLERLTDTKHNSAFNVDQAVAMIVYTNNLEKVTSAGTSYLDCFSGANLRRTEIVCGAWVTQIVCGLGLMGYASYFLIQAGMTPTLAFTLTIVTYVLGAVGTFSSWFLMSRFGRRTLYLYGLGVLATLMLAIGFTSLGGRSSNVSWAVGILLIVWTFFYDCTVGPVCYAIVAEIPSTRLRSKSVSLARNAYNIAAIVVLVLTPQMLNPTAWNWGAKSAFLWAGTGALCFLWTFFRLPEARDRTYAELDWLFEAKISARKFASTHVDSFGRSDAEEKVTEREQQIETA